MFFNILYVYLDKFSIPVIGNNSFEGSFVSYHHTMSCSARVLEQL